MVTVFPGVRTVLLNAFGYGAQAIRLDRTGTVMYFRTGRTFSLFPLFIYVQFDASCRHFGNNATQVSAFLLGGFNRTGNMTKSHVRDYYLGINSGLSLALAITNDDKCNRYSRSFNSMLRSRSTNGRAVA